MKLSKIIAQEPLYFSIVTHIEYYSTFKCAIRENSHILICPYPPEKGQSKHEVSNYASALYI